MFQILLLIIYLAFISLGLPDSLLGAAWPIMYQEFSVPVSYAGGISMIISLGTITPGQSDWLTKKLGTVRVTTISVFITAAALFGFSVSHSYAALCLWAIPYGLGAGSVDASLNNYVALRYESRHMSQLFIACGESGRPFSSVHHGICTDRWKKLEYGLSLYCGTSGCIDGYLIFQLCLCGKRTRLLIRNRLEKKIHKCFPCGRL